mmetsp:Transcript_104631/g.262218  ORF Transcript_104631/g.262218 Transcript_104631/m.262218 type:complete len:87 (+) Transcript_104631:31-291(+)
MPFSIPISLTFATATGEEVIQHVHCEQRSGSASKGLVQEDNAGRHTSAQRRRLTCSSSPSPCASFELVQHLPFDVMHFATLLPSIQ